MKYALQTHQYVLRAWLILQKKLLGKNFWWAVFYFIFILFFNLQHAKRV